MKIKLTALILSLTTCGLIGFAQDTSPPPGGTAPPKPASDAQPAATAKPEAASTAPVKPDEVVPLIVIDEVPLPDAIRNLARQSGLNFLFDQRITSSNQPNISLRLENVTAQEALNAVLDNYNLTLVKEPKSKIARITIRDPRAEDPLVTRVLQLKYSDPTNLVDVIKPTLSTRSRVLADPRTGQLIVTTTEKELDGLLTLVNKLDTQTRQVLIEAHIYETARNPSTVKGIDWSGTFEAQRFQFGNNAQEPVGGIPAQPAIPPIVTPGGSVIQGTPAAQAVPGNPNSILSVPRLLANTAKGFDPRTAFLNADGVSAVLSFLNKDTDTDVVATPRAVTMDNQPAKLSVTKAYPIFNVTPGSANSPAGASTLYTNLGTILTVTPRIAADNNISLKVVPEVSNIDSKDSQTINGLANVANVYAIRRIETVVLIPNGHTLVMGGLINDTSTKVYTKVPILGDAPIIGLAFRHEDKQRSKQNLLIFVTPTVVQDTDFQVAANSADFLKTQTKELPEIKDNAWDSGKPYDWTKSKE